MNRNKKLFILFFCLFISIFLVSSVCALDSLGTFKKGQQVRITQVCADATQVNITSISYPNSTPAAANIQMIKSGQEFYYWFYGTNVVGRYDVRGVSDGCEKTFATYFEITSDGSEKTLIKTDLQFFIFFFISLGFGLLLGILGIYNDARILIFSAIGFFSAGLLSYYYSQFLFMPFLSYSTTIICVGLGMIALAYSIYEWLPR